MFRFLIISSLLVAVSLAEVRPVRSRPMPDGRIVGGVDVDIEDYPYQVSMEYFMSHRCGGSIISEDWVLTAVHCIDGVATDWLQFRVGSTTRGSGGSIHPAAEIIAHPDYDYYTLDSDIALVKVSEPFVYGVGVQPINLATSNPADGEISIVSGWGTLSSGGTSPTTLQAVTVPIVDHDRCNIAYLVYGGITERMLCAGAERGGRDACQGDSGGPLVVNGELVGVVSWGAGCAQARFPGVYASVAHLRDFVTDNTGIN